MRIPARIAVPVLLACVIAATLLGVLGWQLRMAAGNVDQPITPDSGDNFGGTGIAVQPTHEADAALQSIREGDILALQGDWEAAERAYRASVEADGGLPALRKLAQAQLQRRDTEGVEETIDALRRAGARAEDLLLLESIVDLRTGELVRARARLEGASDSPQRQYGLALLAIIEGNHTQAAQLLTEVAAGWEPVLRTYARTLHAAYDEFALFPEGNNAHLITLLSRALAQVQECELALPLLVRVTSEENDYRDAWIVQGYCELMTERFDQAVISLEHAYGIDPQKSEIQYFLARTYAARGEHGNAFTFYEYALENGFEPQAEVRNALAREALALGNGTLALEQYEQAASYADATVQAYGSYVEAAMALQRNDDALRMAQAAVDRFPDSAHAYELLGWAAISAGHKDAARSALEHARDLDPSSTSIAQRLAALETEE